MYITTNTPCGFAFNRSFFFYLNSASPKPELMVMYSMLSQLTSHHSSLYSWMKCLHLLKSLIHSGCMFAISDCVWNMCAVVFSFSLTLKTMRSRMICGSTLSFHQSPLHIIGASKVVAITLKKGELCESLGWALCSFIQIVSISLYTDIYNFIRPLRNSCFCNSVLKATDHDGSL